MLPESGGTELDSRWVHDNLSAPLWIKYISLCQSIQINLTNMYI